MTDSAFAFGLGVGTHNSKGQWLEIFFPKPLLAPSAPLAAAAASCDSGKALSADQLSALQGALHEAGEIEQAALAAQFADSQQPAVAVLLEEDKAPGQREERDEKIHSQFPLCLSSSTFA